MQNASRSLCVSCFALLCSLGALAQQQANPPAKPAQPAKAPAATKPRAKKVWTNDDMPSVKGDVSVVGDGSSGVSKSKSNSTPSANENGVVESFRKQLARLQAQLDATNKRINELQNFKAENSAPSGGIDPRHGYSMTPVADQIKQLEEKKKQIQAAIDDLEDQARKKGIEPGELR
jgi:hypothetical protein